MCDCTLQVDAYDCAHLWQQEQQQVQKLHESLKCPLKNSTQEAPQSSSTQESSSSKNTTGKGKGKGKLTQQTKMKELKIQPLAKENKKNKKLRCSLLDGNWKTRTKQLLYLAQLVCKFSQPEVQMIFQLCH